MENENSVLIKHFPLNGDNHFAMISIYREDRYLWSKAMNMHLNDDGNVIVFIEAALGNLSASVSNLKADREKAIIRKLKHSINTFYDLPINQNIPDFEPVDVDLSIFKSINWEKNLDAYQELKSLGNPSVVNAIFGVDPCQC